MCAYVYVCVCVVVAFRVFACVCVPPKYGESDENGWLALAMER